jgi:tRNA dimethylallyltransferase
VAERYGCPILNADSRQLYREIPIGTAAPTAAEQQRVKHYFVGTRSLREDCNAGMYARDAVELLTCLARQDDGRTYEPFAILTGGSMLYIDAVCQGLDDIPKVSEATRQSVQDAYRTNGLAWLQGEVERRDAKYWLEVDRQNPQRLMHCLEICLETGRPYSDYRTGIQAPQHPWQTLKIGLERPRDVLYERINRRVEQMIADGLEAEARSVYPLRHLNSLNTVGYKEMFAYFDGQLTLPEAINLIQQNSRHYAKRQMTWFRRQNDIHWLQAEQDYETQLDFIDTCLRAV